MSGRNPAVTFGRARLPQALAGPLMALPRGIRGRTVGLILLAHNQGLDIQKLVSAATELRRLGVLLNQSLRVSRGSSVDAQALRDAVQKVKGLWP
jgi:hypothetical protein